MAWFTLVDAEGAAFGVENEGHAADGRFKGFHFERDIFFLQSANGAVEIIHLKGDAGPFGGGRPARGLSNGKCASCDFVFRPGTFRAVVHHGRCQADNVLVKGSGTGHVNDRVAGEGKFEDFHANTEKKSGGSLVDCGDDFAGGIENIVPTNNVERAGGEGGFAGGDIVAFETHDQGNAQPGFRRSSENALGDDVAIHDAAKDIHQDAFDIWIGQNNAERCGNLLLARTAADVEKIRRAAAAILDNIHGGHGETGSVDQTGNVAVESDVVERMFRSGHFAWIFLGDVAVGHDLGVTVKRVVVEIKLGVEREKFARIGNDERIDLDHRTIGFDEEFVEIAKKFDGLSGKFAFETENGGEFATLKSLQSKKGMNVFVMNFFWRMLGDFLDVHAAFGAGDDGVAAGRAILQNGKIQFPRDVYGGSDEDFRDFFAFGSGLMCDQGLAEHFCGELTRFRGRIGEMHPAFESVGKSAFAASTGVDLGFYDNFSSQLGGDFFGFLRCGGDASRLGGDVVFGKKFPGLVFVNVHVKRGSPEKNGSGESAKLETERESVNPGIHFFCQTNEKPFCAVDTTVQDSVMDEEFARQLAKLGLHIDNVEESFARSSGPGGQNVNKVSTSVSLVHRPCGTRVTVQDSRSQHTNRQLARERLIAAIREQRVAARAALVQEREKRRRATRPKPRGVKERILEGKKNRSAIKKMRGRVDRHH